MNIWELKVGEVGVASNGERFRVIRDIRERRPMIGVVRVRVTEDQDGRTQKFIRGIEVERAVN